MPEMTWILVLILIHGEIPSVERLGGFKSEQECVSVGAAWATYLRAREGSTDIPIFKCEQKGPR